MGCPLDLSPNSLQRGLWSAATTRLEQPSTKCQALSSASATARASPSMGAYLDSAACMNLDPTRVTFHPSWQQNTSWDGHWQCFWNSQYPTPSLFQSVARHVGRSLLDMRTPSLILDVISSLDTSNACFRSSVHMNWAEGFRRARNWCHGEGECHLVDQPEPGSDVRDSIGGGEVSYGSQILVASLDFCVGNLEHSKLHLILCEAEFVGIQGDPVTGADVQPLCGLVEGVFDGGGP